MTSMRERPSDAEVDAWVAQARPHVMAHARSRRWWRRLSRPTVALGVVGLVAAGGIAYAAVEQTRAGQALPEIRRGSSVVEIGHPGPGDKWLNLSVTYRCKKGQTISVRDDTHELMAGNCPEGGGALGSSGTSLSVPVDEIRGTRLTVSSDISHGYGLNAVWARSLPSVSPEEALQNARKRGGLEGSR